MKQNDKRPSLFANSAKREKAKHQTVTRVKEDDVVSGERSNENGAQPELNVSNVDKMTGESRGKTNSD